MLQDIINKKGHESEIQKYLQDNPRLLLSAANYDEIYPKFKLGSEYECDFILYSMLSTCSKTTIVELKLPNAKLLTKSNIPTKDLSLALSQVNRYMCWIHDNQNYFRKQIYNAWTTRSVYDKICNIITGYRNYINSIIVIGQRTQFSDEENLYRQNIYHTTHGRIEIIPYDRLIEFENENRN